jgi:bacteriorhodopsin
MCVCVCVCVCVYVCVCVMCVSVVRHRQGYFPLCLPEFVHTSSVARQIIAKFEK